MNISGSAFYNACVGTIQQTLEVKKIQQLQVADKNQQLQTEKLQRVQQTEAPAENNSESASTVKQLTQQNQSGLSEQNNQHSSQASPYQNSKTQFDSGTNQANQALDSYSALNQFQQKEQLHQTLGIDIYV